MSNSLVPAKFRNRIDRLAPAITLKALSALGATEMPKVIQRLYELAQDSNPRIALDAIEKILRYSGVEKFVEAGIKVASEAASENEDDEEEDDRAARRKRLARKYHPA